MTQVGIKELKAHTSDLVLRVEERGEAIDVTRGRAVVARLIPVGARRAVTDEEIDQYLAELDALAADIGKRWPKGVSAVDAVRDVRRDL